MNESYLFLSFTLQLIIGFNQMLRVFLNFNRLFTDVDHLLFIYTFHFFLIADVLSAAFSFVRFQFLMRSLLNFFAFSIQFDPKEKSYHSKQKSNEEQSCYNPCSIANFLTA